MTDGTAEYDAAYRHQVGFYYDLIKAAAQRMTIAQAYELRAHVARRSPSPPAGCARRRCWRPSASPRRTTRPDAWRYLVEVQDKGLPPNDAAYR
jgi:hypothetical protein